MQKLTMISIILLLGLTSLFSSDQLNINDILTNEEADKVFSGEIITRMYLKYNTKNENTDLSILPPKTKYTNEDFSKYEMITDEKAFFPYEIKSEDDKLKFYNNMTAFTKLAGMKYWSRRVKDVEELLLKSHRIAGKKGYFKKDDLKYDQIKPELTSYYVQKDNKFGTLTFKSDLYNEGNNFTMVNTCMEGIPLASKEGEYKVIATFVYDEEKKGFFYYSIYAMRIRTEWLLKDGGIITLRPTTFSNRLRAGSVHFAKLLGLDWENKLNPWHEKTLKSQKLSL